jgi:hypothetical protein
VSDSHGVVGVAVHQDHLKNHVKILDALRKEDKEKA